MRPLAALLLAFAAGCGHGRAAVIAAHVDVGQGDAEEALEGASGTLDCPNELFPQDLGHSDGDGDLRAQHMGAVPLACAMNITMAGYRPYKATLRDVCTAPDSGGCQSVDVRVVLAPEPGKPPGESK